MSFEAVNIQSEVLYKLFQRLEVFGKVLYIFFRWLEVAIGVGWY